MNKRETGYYWVRDGRWIAAYWEDGDWSVTGDEGLYGDADFDEIGPPCRKEDADEVAELRALISRQHRRMVEASEIYVIAHPRPEHPQGYMPDLGELLRWLVEERRRLLCEKCHGKGASKGK